MDKKVLKAVTVFLGILTVLVCVTFPFFPKLHTYAVAAREARETARANEHIAIKRQDPEKVVEADNSTSAQLKIELPKGLTEQDISFENDYLDQTIYIRFPNGVDDYFADYSMSGSSDHIAGISYYKENGDGVIMMELDQVCELQDTVDSGYLYVDFIDPHEIYDKVVVIDAGHGAKAVGAVKQGIYEKDIDLAIVLELKKILDADTEDHIGVYYTRTDDSDPSLEKRVQLANKANADLFISVHNNSSASGKMSGMNGTQVLYSESDDSELSSQRLAQICLDHVSSAFESTSIGLLPGDDIYIIRSSEVPVALVEVGFMTNADELAKLNSQEYQAKAAEGIYEAIKQAFEEGY